MGMKAKHGLVKVTDAELGEVYLRTSFHDAADVDRRMETHGYRRGEYQILVHRKDEEFTPWQDAIVIWPGEPGFKSHEDSCDL